MVVTLSLAKRLGVVGYGRIEFAFNVVFWLVLLVRDSSDVIVARELSRHPRLIRPLVDHVLAIKGLFSLVLFAGLAVVGGPDAAGSSGLVGADALRADALHDGDRARLRLSRHRAHGPAGGVALPADLRLRGRGPGMGRRRRADRLGPGLAGGRRGQRDRAGLAALPEALPDCRGPGWACGSSASSCQRGRTVCLIQLSQAVISTADLLVVGLMSSWWDVGRYGAPHRMVTALLTFGLIFQQAAFPTLSRLWRHTARPGGSAGLAGRGPGDRAGAGGGRRDGAGRAAGPADAAGGLRRGRTAAGPGDLAGAAADPGVPVPDDADRAEPRERWGSARWCWRPWGSGPLVAVFRVDFGLPGAAAAVLLLGLGLVLAGYGSLAREGRQPAWHHHLGRPLAASLVMVPVCLVLQHWHVMLAVSGRRRDLLRRAS